VHVKSENIGCIGGLIVFLLGTGAGFGYAVAVRAFLGLKEGEELSGGSTAVLVCFVVWLGLGIGVARMASKVIPPGVKKANHQMEFPRLKELLAQGWALGEKPSDAN
jgi:hypothetical protein